MLLFDALSERELKEGLKALGVQPGRDLCVHSQLFSFGKPHLLKALLLAKIVDILRQCVGKACLIMPTFTYSFCKGLPFNSLKSKSTMGALSEFYRHQSGVKRTKDPIFSFAVSGENEEDYLHDTTSCFGKNSVYEVLESKKGGILHLGDLREGWTFSHYVEEKAGVKYRYLKTFSGLLDGKESKMALNVRDLDAPSTLCVDKNVEILKNAGVLKLKSFLKGELAYMEAAPYAQALRVALARDAHALIKDANA